MKLALAIFAIAIISSAFAEDIKLPNGTVLKDATITKSDAATVPLYASTPELALAALVAR